jgi:hypothetical protein
MVRAMRANALLILPCIRPTGLHGELTMFKLHYLTGALVDLSLAAGISVASAAETGTKTMPDSSIHPPATPAPVFRPSRHHWCYLPSDGCDYQHSEQN